MNSGPLTYNAETQEYQLLLKNGPHAGNVYPTELVACKDPFCRCATITLLCSSVDEDSDPDTAPLALHLDVKERSITQRNKQPSQALSLGESLIAELDETGWEQLATYFYVFKELITGEIDYAELDAPFSAENMTDPSLMVAYKEILPFAKHFSLMLGGTPWVFLDQYCVNPDCDCRDVSFELVQITTLTGEQKHSTQYISTAIYDSRHDKFRPREGAWPKKPTLKAVVRALREAHPNFAKEIQKRRCVLRALYRNTRKRKGWAVPPAPQPESTKVGRNDPCPCGSESKYKKCCGRMV